MQVLIIKKRFQKYKIEHKYLKLKVLHVQKVQLGIRSILKFLKNICMNKTKMKSCL